MRINYIAAFDDNLLEGTLILEMFLTEVENAKSADIVETTMIQKVIENTLNPNNSQDQLYDKCHIKTTIPPVFKQSYERNCR